MTFSASTGTTVPQHLVVTRKSQGWGLLSISSRKSSKGFKGLKECGAFCNTSPTVVPPLKGYITTQQSHFIQLLPALSPIPDWHGMGPVLVLSTLKIL